MFHLIAVYSIPHYLLISHNIGAIFTTYRLLASDEERPLPVTLDSTYINQLHSELETDGRNIKESGYYDLVAMQLAHGHSVSLIEGGDIKYVAELMDYYVDHDIIFIYILFINAIRDRLQKRWKRIGRIIF